MFPEGRAWGRATGISEPLVFCKNLFSNWATWLLIPGLAQDTYTYKVSLPGRITLSLVHSDSSEWLFSKCMFEISLSQCLPFVHKALCFHHRTSTTLLSLSLCLVCKSDVSSKYHQLLFIKQMRYQLCLYLEMIYSVEPPEVSDLRRLNICLRACGIFHTVSAQERRLSSWSRKGEYH